MKIGLLTAPFGRESLETVVDFAASAGFDALEVAATPGSRHLDPAQFSEARAGEIKALLGEKRLEVSSLAAYMNVTAPDPAERQRVTDHLKKAVDAAAMVGTGVVCTMAGMPMPGKDRMRTIEEDVPGALGPVVEYAASRGIKIALENWTATNIQNLAHWDRIFQVLPAPNFGLNFDPSHLLWQQIDYIEAVYRFRDRIFHTHAKDTEVRAHDLRYYGNQSGGWWRYVIPGYGKVNWGEYVAALRNVGYNGVMSIEHEDGALGREEGFVKGLNYLRLFA